MTTALILHPARARQLAACAVARAARRPRTHCGHGHRMAGDNLMIDSTTGRRRCRACWRIALGRVQRCEMGRRRRPRHTPARITLQELQMVHADVTGDSDAMRRFLEARRPSPRPRALTPAMPAVTGVDALVLEAVSHAPRTLAETAVAYYAGAVARGVTVTPAGHVLTRQTAMDVANRALGKLCRLGMVTMRQRAGRRVYVVRREAVA